MPKTTRRDGLSPRYHETEPDTRVYIGDSSELLPEVPDLFTGSGGAAAGQPARGAVDLVFADPPFNWARDYDRHRVGDAWDDNIPDQDYLDFTKRWLDGCVRALKPTGSMWVNIPDDWAAEIVVHLKDDRDASGGKRERMHMINWCVWHYRFGQNTMGRFINSKVHVLYFAKDPSERTWNAEPVLERSDRATTYGDARTFNKKTGHAGKRVPMDVWYGKNFGRIQGNNKERRANHDNQIPEVYMERVIRATSNEGDLVLDPFLGSGTTGVVARELGRRFVGIEYAESNAKSAWERITSIGTVRVKKDHPTEHASAIFEARGRSTPAGNTSG